jgi:transcriptional regulator with XRE-family HTH domain
MSKGSDHYNFGAVSPRRILDGDPHYLARVLRALRIRHGLTLAALARIVGVTHPTIAAWEIGTGKLDAGAFDRIAEHLEMSTPDLLRHGMRLIAKEKPPKSSRRAA